LANDLDAERINQLRNFSLRVEIPVESLVSEGEEGENEEEVEENDVLDEDIPTDVNIPPDVDIPPDIDIPTSHVEQQ
jgi:CO dehydrogenase/acetyl-CoA synthase beta subunit